MKQSFKQQFIGLFLLTTVLFGNIFALAQTRRIGGTSTPAKTSVPGGKTTAASQPPKNEKDCKSGYSGSVTYTQTLTDSWRGKFGSYHTRKKVIQVNIPIRDDGRQTGSALMSPDGGVNGTFNFKSQATATMTDSDVTVNNSEGEDICDLTGKKKTYEKRTSQTDIQAQASGAGEVTVYLRLSGNKFYLSSDLPRVNGQGTQTWKSGATGSCTPKPPINGSRTSTINNDKLSSFYTDENKITFNPTSFNRLSGANTKVSSDGKTVETITWNLSRCAPPLRIENIAFEHHVVPNPTVWRGIDPLNGTIDGNLVKVKAKIYNGGGDTAYANVKFSETTGGAELPNNTISAAIKPGEYRDVEYEWDTNGFAWDDNQKAKMEREIKVELDGDTQTEKIKILPKPVVLVHGLWSNADAWANYPIYLRNAHSYDWEGFAVGSDPKNGKMNTGDFAGNWKPTNTIFQNSQELAKQIKYVRETKNAWHIDIVAHSMGGLISRHYIHNFMQPVFDGKPEAAHLVMLGTPNQGSPCANMVHGLFHMFGNDAMLAMKELNTYSVSKFNTINTNRKNVKFSILAGYTVPTTCQSWGISDGVVPLRSALYNISDRDYSPRIHTELTKKADFEKFVLPRLAVGPRKARADNLAAAIETAAQETLAQANIDEFAPSDRYGFNSYFQKVSFKSENRQDDDGEEDLKDVTTRQKIELQAKETKEIEIPVRDGKHAGVLIVASTAVVATLLDQTGAIVGKSVYDRPDAPRDLFRTINVDRDVKNGVWKLRLENFDASRTTVFVAGWTNNGATSALTIEAGKPAAGSVPLQAKWTENNAPVTGAKITGKIAGQETVIEFFDDGRHGDGAENDGIYGGKVERLPKGEYFIEARAEANNQTKMAVAPITIGDFAPTKAATTKRKGK